MDENHKEFIKNYIKQLDENGDDSEDSINIDEYLKDDDPLSDLALLNQSSDFISDKNSEANSSNDDQSSDNHPYRSFSPYVSLYPHGSSLSSSSENNNESGSDEDEDNQQTFQDTTNLSEFLDQLSDSDMDDDQADSFINKLLQNYVKKDGSLFENTIFQLPNRQFMIAMNELNYMKNLGMFDFWNGPNITLEQFINHIKDGTFQNMVLLTGAGISVGAGIPDFRSSTGLYNTISNYHVPPFEDPSIVFDLRFFQVYPVIFYILSSQLFYNENPDTLPHPTPAHFLIKLLQNHHVMTRLYTQNIDGLELKAGIDKELCIMGHGHFFTAHCIHCKRPYSIERIQECVKNKVIPVCENCYRYVKPDIVFFYEDLNDDFYQQLPPDMNKADSIMIMGTSLQVKPMGLIPLMTSVKTPRLLMNKERVGLFDLLLYNDVCMYNDLQDSCMYIINQLGWLDEFDALIQQYKEKNHIQSFLWEKTYHRTPVLTPTEPIMNECDLQEEDEDMEGDSSVDEKENEDAPMNEEEEEEHSPVNEENEDSPAPEQGHPASSPQDSHPSRPSYQVYEEYYEKYSYIPHLDRDLIDAFRLMEDLFKNHEQNQSPVDPEELEKQIHDPNNFDIFLWVNENTPEGQRRLKSCPYPQ